MKIITANTNGIRAAAKKGFFDWLEKQDADVTCIQETKAQIHQLEDPMFHPGFSYYNDAVKKGYSGTALYCKREPDDLISGTGYETFDSEGRYLEAKFGNLSVISLYMPSGSAKDERQLIKYECMDFFMNLMEEMKSSGRDYIICGDWNIAHKNEDIRNWKGNKKNSGFLPEERAWLDTLFDDVGFVDAFRELEQEEHSYTWWSNRGQAYANNTGWRIDYHVLSPSLKGTVKKTEIYKDEKFSDHAPLIIDYDYDI
ncbi:exodeoxyribonuclease III [Cocleimonas sp. KMM 6892]|uniref:exodeoxyribonuclease III n=1 Tax=unclassified Cocleimonas TaxID=2639732 RepID=UPI002DB8B4D3|nr:MULTISPECIES: exodeoxyribonuclease III [unclassified Cocleimonas]MEB8431353.1 exodeoxyribonuclease III [Cocleimonas sp. KMM 6892]MEC4713875.1 exodeoxyribonuclease III [Cocleimonas sp. KMM 6895]MEC4743206.1 exodeoxyribonuclease III [Cocleimonas sp. KMM 6896]